MLGFFKKRKPPEKKPSREEIIAQATKNARKAREEIGDENIQKMAAALKRLEDPAQQSNGKQAQEQIKKMDQGHVADNLKIILKEDQ